MKLAIALLTVLWVQSIGAQTAADKVVLWRLVPTNYQDKAFSVSEFRQILESSPPREVIVQEGQTLSSILRDNFNVVQYHNNAVYEEILAKVGALNGKLNVNQLAAQERLAIPELPTAANPSAVRRPEPGPPVVALGLESNNYSWSGRVPGSGVGSR